MEAKISILKTEHQDSDAQDYAVDCEGPEAVLLKVAHEEFDYHQSCDEGDHSAECQNDPLICREFEACF